MTLVTVNAYFQVQKILRPFMKVNAYYNNNKKKISGKGDDLIPGSILQ